MKGVATSDLHLGHRRHAASEGGRNVRETDVERAWERAVENIVRAAPDLVTIAGDCFEHPRVGTAAEIAFRTGIRRIVTETDAHVVILQGNHCAVKTAGSTSPVRIPEDYERVEVVTSPRRLTFYTDDGELVSVACFPYTSLREEETYSLEPAEDADVNVLALHGAVKGDEDADALPWFYVSGRPLDVGREAERWDVVACGDYHDFRRLHPDRLAFYSGAIERTSSDIWSESAEKGVVVYDTQAGELELVTHDVRPVHDYDVSDVLEDALGTPGNVNYALEQISELEDVHNNAIVRLQAFDFPREQRDRIDWEAVRSLKATCLHFQLDLRWSEGEVAFRDRRDGPARTIEDDARAFFADDDPAVRRCAYSYLEIGEEETPDTETSDGSQAGESPRSAPSGAADQEVALVCPNCGNRDTYERGHKMPCSAGCGATMIPDPEATVEMQHKQITTGGAS